MGREERLLAWAIRDCKTRIAINEAVIKTINEIRDMLDCGFLTDREFVDVWNRIDGGDGNG